MSVGDAQTLMHRADVCGRGVHLGGGAEADRRHVLDRGLQPGPRIVLERRLLVEEVHRLGVQCLQQQRAQSAHHGQRLAVHPPGDAARAEQLPAGRMTRELIAFVVAHHCPPRTR